LICGFNVGDGPEATGGSEWACSTDNGESWQYGGMILPRQENPTRANTMRLSRTNDKIIAYGQRSYPINNNFTFGSMKIDAVFCTSNAAEINWSEPEVIPLSQAVPIEVSSPIVVLKSGKWLAPAGFLTDKDHLGEKVVVRESTDNGKSWPNEYAIFHDPDGIKGFFEYKIIETIPDRLLAFAWTVELGSYNDLNNHYSFSNDGGKSWTPATTTELNGQTMNPLWLGDDRFLLIYNYRQSPQGIRIVEAEISENYCRVLRDEFLWQPACSIETNKNGIDSFDSFKFGLPSLTQLDDDTFLAVFWCFAAGKYGTKAIKLKLN